MIIDIDPIINKAFPAVTDKSWKYDDICYYAQSDVTCYVLRGEHGDILIDTGMPQVWHGLHEWLKEYDIRYVLLTHAHSAQIQIQELHAMDERQSVQKSSLQCGYLL